MSKPLTDLVNFGIGAVQTIQEESLSILENIKKRIEELEAAGASTQSENANKIRKLASDLGARFGQPQATSKPKKAAAKPKAAKSAKAKTATKATSAAAAKPSAKTKKTSTAKPAAKAAGTKSAAGGTRKKALKSAAENLK